MNERMVRNANPNLELVGSRPALMPTVITGNVPLDAPALNFKVVGVGGAGGNVIDRLVSDQIGNIETLAVNTDHQALRAGRAAQVVCLGEALTRGLGAGGDPSIGQQAAEASIGALTEALRGADLVFIAAGMGGGTGTGAAPIVAQVARELGALTVALVTRPFAFEGRRRAQVAEQGLSQLRTIADTVIVVPNDRLLEAAARTTTVQEAFGMADAVLRHGVQSIADIVTRHGLINVDFADVRAIMGQAGPALLGIGVGHGPDRTAEAARRAMACPLLEGRLEGARRLLLTITGGEDLGLLEIQRAAEIVASLVDPDANIIFGAVIDPSFTTGQVRVTLVATGFSLNEAPPSLAPRATVASPVPPAPKFFDQSRATPAPSPRPSPLPTPMAVRPFTPRPPVEDALDIPPFLQRFGRR